MEDERFAHIATDQKFRRIPKGKKKLEIGKRFKGVFKDERFKLKQTVDKRGRPVNRSNVDELKKFYDLSSDEVDSDDDEKSEKAEEEEETKPNIEEEEIVDSLQVKDKSDKAITVEVKKKLKNLNVDYARGEGALVSDSSSDDEEESDVESESETIEHKWGELDNDAVQTDEVTKRLAACNMDWDRIRAVDLMVLFNSFLPPGGLLHSVAIYPSEFGKQRMQEEEVKGPIELVEDTKDNDDANDDNEEGAKYHMEKLRQYQLNRLKYYYAVITFDSPSSANKVYTECDGMEYESSATKIDLRFIPDDMEFEDEPKEFCDKLPEVSKYKPRFFTTTALQQAKVDLTWDETNPDRLELAEKLSKGKLDEIDKTELQNYLATNSEDGDSNPLDKYKALLAEIENKEKEKDKEDVQMEITWGIGAEEEAKKLVKKKMAETENKTPFEQYLDKRKEKLKEKKKKNKQNSLDEESDSDEIDMDDPYFAEEFNKPEFKKAKSRTKKNDDENEEGEQNDTGLLNLMFDDELDGKKHFNIKKLIQSEKEQNKKKRRKGKNKNKEDDDDDEPGIVDFRPNVEDSRFAAIFTAPQFNIDTSDPHYKPIKGMEEFVKAKLKRRNDNEEDDNAAKKQKQNKKSTELNHLVTNIKRNVNTFKK